MFEKFISQTNSGVSALDQPGNIDRNERLWTVFDYPKHGFKCREWIVGDFGSCCADSSQNARLAGVWHADESNVGEQLQIQPYSSNLAFTTSLSE